MQTVERVSVFIHARSGPREVFCIEYIITFVDLTQIPRFLLSFRKKPSFAHQQEGCRTYGCRLFRDRRNKLCLVRRRGGADN